MRGDESGVGGFIEDIPVLVFVLGGVVTLIGTGTWAAAYLADDVREETLRDLATDTIDRVLWTLSKGLEGTKGLDAAATTNISGAFAGVPEGIGWLLSVDMLHPCSEQVLLISSGCLQNPTRTASESRLLNSECDGMSAMVRVTVVVWSC